jgi:hypothetical protein
MLKRIHVTIIVFTLLLLAIVLTLASFSAIHISKQEETEPLQTQTPTPTQITVLAELKIYPGRTHITLISGIPNNDEVAKDLISFFKEN